MGYKLAILLSHIFDPIFLSLLTLFLVINETSLIPTHKLGWYTIVIFVAFLPVLAFFIYQRTTGKISDWFISKRGERKDVLLVAVVSSLALLIVTLFLKSPLLLFLFTIITFVINGITYFLTAYTSFKISVHAMSTTLFVLVLILVYSPGLWPSALFIPAVAWSRWKLHGHTLSELLGGTGLSLFVTLAAFKLFGLI